MDRTVGKKHRSEYMFVLIFIVLVFFGVVYSSTEIHYPCKTARCDANCSLGATCSLGAAYPSGAGGACWLKARGRSGFTRLICTPPTFSVLSTVWNNDSGVFVHVELWDSSLFMVLTVTNFTGSDRGTYRCNFTGQSHLKLRNEPWVVDFIAHPLPPESTTFAVVETTTMTTTTVSTPSVNVQQMFTIEPVQSIDAHSSSHSGSVTFLAIFLVSVAVGLLWFLIRSRATSRIGASHAHESTAFSVDFMEADL